jgi:hypothetical protein
MSGPTLHHTTDTIARQGFRGLVLFVAGLAGGLSASAAAAVSYPVLPAADARPIGGGFLDPTPAALQTATPLRLVANIPAYRLDVYLDGELAASFPMTVGSPRNRTPTGHYHIEKMIWNPWWHPPAHRRPRDRVTPPGPRNPMGRVKIHFSSLYYFHGTALENEIGRPTSRGCVRLRNEDAIALGRMINEHVGWPVPPGELESLVRQPRRTRNVRLPVAVPVTLLYQPVELRLGRIHVHEDIYRQVPRPVLEQAVDALSEAGITRRLVDMEALATALEGPRPKAFAVEEVLLPIAAEATWISRLEPSRIGPAGPVE